MIDSSLQRIDPLGSLAGRRFTLGAAVLVAVMAVLGAVGSRSAPLPTLLTIALFAVSAGVLSVTVLRTSGPIGRLAAVSTLVIGGWGFAAATLLLTDGGVPGRAWAPFALAILLVALVPYRPQPAMVAAIVLLAVWSAAVVSLDPRSAAISPAGYAQVAAVLPILGLPLAGVAFTSHMMRFVMEWRRGALAATAAEVSGHEPDITRAVQRTRVEILNQDVVPFFADIAAKNEIDDDDRRRARELAESIRSIMVADIERSWLDDVVVPRASTADMNSVIHDPSGIAQFMDLDQRAVVRAVVSQLRVAQIEPPGLSVELLEGSRACEVILSARVRISGRELRSLLRPYLAVMATVFSDLSFRIHDNTLRMRFCYDRP